MRVLIVTNPFGDFTRGDQIVDPKQIEDLINGPFAANVVPTDVPDDSVAGAVASKPKK